MEKFFERRGLPFCIQGDGDIVTIDETEFCVVSSLPCRRLFIRTDVIPHPFDVGVKQVEALLVAEDSCFLVDKIVAIAADMGARIDLQSLLFQDVGVPFGEDSPTQPCSNSTHVVFLCLVDLVRCKPRTGKDVLGGIADFDVIQLSLSTTTCAVKANIGIGIVIQIRPEVEIEEERC